MVSPSAPPLTIDNVMEFVDLLHPDVRKDVLSFDTKQRYLIPPTIPQERGGGGFGRYAKAMRDNVRGLWMEELGFADFLDSMFLTITSGLTRAFNEGLKQCKPAGEMTAEAKAVLDSIIANEIQWSGKFGDHILDNTREDGGKLAPLLQRAEMWALTYPETTNTALLYCPNNPNLIWKYGNTKEHCTDALRLHGKVYKAVVWRKFGVVPQSSQLECGGWRCACSLTLTDEKAIPGRPPKLTGQKEIPWWRVFENVAAKGSPKSGHRGHAGRPGKRGGSAPKGGGVLGFSDITFTKPTREERRKIGAEIEDWEGKRGEIAEEAFLQIGPFDGAAIHNKDGDLVGLASYFVDKDASELELMNFATARPGVGRASMAHIGQVALDNSIDKVILYADNDGAVAFFNALGLTNIRGNDFEWSSSDIKAFVESQKGSKEIDNEPENGAFVSSRKGDTR